MSKPRGNNLAATSSSLALPFSKAISPFPAFGLLDFGECAVDVGFLSFTRHPLLAGSF